MATIKSYTDINQSRKLVEILPFESADMWWAERYAGKVMANSQYIVEEKPMFYLSLIKPSDSNCSQDIIKDIPCWSLAALLNVLSEIKPQVYTPILFPSGGKWILQFAEYGHGNICEVTCDNPIDACMDMIEKLHKLNLL